MKNNKGRINIILLIIFLMVSSSLTGCLNSKNAETVKPSLVDDYYGAINYDLLQEKTIPPTEGQWSYFYELDEKISAQLQEIVTELSISGETYPKDSSEQKISDLYACAMDKEHRNIQGLTSIMPYLDEIESAQNLDEYTDGLATLSQIGQYSLIHYSYFQDDMNSDNMVLAFQSLNDLIGKEYIENDEMQEYCDAYKEYIKEMLILSGEEKEDAEKNADLIYQFVSEVALEALKPEEFYNTEAYYNVYTYDEVLSLYSNINMENYLEAQGLSKDDHYIVMEVDAAKKINEMLTEENLPVLKEYTKFVLLNDLARYLPESYRDLKLNMEMKLSGSTEQKTDERLAFDDVSRLLEWEFGKIYVDEYFNEEAKQNVKNMVAMIINQYKETINSQDWMSEETKQKAILKLDTMNLKIGYPDVWSTIGDYLQVTSMDEGGSYLSNVVEILKASNQYNYDEYKKGVNREQWYMTPQTINAYYNPSNNEIVFPTAILQAPFFDQNRSMGENLGGIGGIIAHEISHAFDINGSLYDEKGNYNIWWTESEYEKYDAMSQKIIDYYGNYTISTGESVDGTMTLSENIADLGAVSTVTAVAKEQGEALDDVYSTWATIWANRMTEDLEKKLLATDVHSPKFVRVNAVLSSIDEFYDTYDIKEGDKMYVAPEDRVAIWQTEPMQ